MARVGARKAGDEIARSAQRFVRRSVEIEDAAVVRFREALEAGVPTARRVVRSAWQDDPPSLADVATVSRLTELHTAALTKALEAWDEALWQIMVAGIRSAERELRWIVRFAESEDMPIVTRVAESMMVHALPTWEQGHTRARAGVSYTAETFREQVVRQALLAREAEDDVDVVEARILEPGKVDAHGISGRGVWWRSVDSLSSGLTTISVQSANLVKQQSIELFNARAVR